MARPSSSTIFTRPATVRYRHHLDRIAACDFPTRAWRAVSGTPQEPSEFFIDIAVPRDVSPEMGKLDGIFTYDIDDLQQAVSSHVADRRQEAERAEALIAGKSSASKRACTRSMWFQQ